MKRIDILISFFFLIHLWMDLLLRNNAPPKAKVNKKTLINTIWIIMPWKKYPEKKYQYIMIIYEWKYWENTSYKL